MLSALYLSSFQEIIYLTSPSSVIEGYDIVEKISKVERDSRDMPLKKVFLKKVTLKE